jgi:hypothetical protein
MRAEAILYVAERLADAVEGVNALLASVPKEAGWATPPNVTVVDAVTYPWVSRGILDRTKMKAGPWLLVGANSDIAGSARPEDAVRPLIDVVVRYACAGTDAVTLKDLTRFESITLRAALRSVLAPWNATDAPENVSRNLVELEAPVWRWVDPQEASTDDVLSSALVLSFGVIDPWAIGTL